MEEQKTKGKKIRKIIHIDCDIMWYYVVLYLESLNAVCAMKDEKFCELYKNLYDYAESKLTLYDGKLVDCYVIFEQD